MSPRTLDGRPCFLTEPKKSSRIVTTLLLVLHERYIIFLLNPSIPLCITNFNQTSKCEMKAHTESPGMKENLLVAEARILQFQNLKPF